MSRKISLLKYTNILADLLLEKEGILKHYLIDLFNERLHIRIEIEKQQGRNPRFLRKSPPRCQT